MTDVTDATFSSAVLDRSAVVPVVVDLWAPWCGPCRQLTPIIEKVVAEQGGRVDLVKVNVDENPQVAQMFQVQSIPAVFGVKNGQVAGSFIGAQGEPAVRQFVESLLPSEDEARLATLVAAGDEASLRAALEIDPGHVLAVTALAELLVDTGRGDEALTLLARIPETDDTRRIAALARIGGPDAAEQLEIEAKLEALLDRAKTDDDARQEFVDLLELLGPHHPKTGEFRRRLASVLY